MYGIVCVLTCRDEVFRIENILIEVDNVFYPYRIHVVNDQPVIDRVIWTGKVVTEISADTEVANFFPLVRAVEILIEPTLTTKGGVTYSSTYTEILEPFLEGWVREQFRI